MWEDLPILSVGAETDSPRTGLVVLWECVLQERRSSPYTTQRNAGFVSTPIILSSGGTIQPLRSYRANLTFHPNSPAFRGASCRANLLPSYRRGSCVHPNASICVSLRKHPCVAVRRTAGETYVGMNRVVAILKESSSMSATNILSERVVGDIITDRTILSETSIRETTTGGVAPPPATY